MTSQVVVFMPEAITLTDKQKQLGNQVKTSNSRIRIKEVESIHIKYHDIFTHPPLPSLPRKISSSASE